MDDLPMIEPDPDKHRKTESWFIRIATVVAVGVVIIISIVCDTDTLVWLIVGMVLSQAWLEIQDMRSRRREQEVDRLLHRYGIR